MAFGDINATAFNERVKLIASIFQGLGTALIIATAGVAWKDGFQPYLLFWAPVALLLLGLGFHWLRNMVE